MNAEQHWDRVVADFEDLPDVSTGKMFSATGLRYHERFFAMLSRGRLVVKLPAAALDELVAAGVGERFEPGPGRVTKEWFTVPVERHRRWRALVDEALTFAKSNRASGKATPKRRKATPSPRS